MIHLYVSTSVLALAGGQSGDPNSPHFDDQIQNYAVIKWKDVPYYKEDVLKRAKETYNQEKENKLIL